MNSRRIVIDSNVYLSALLFGGNPRLVVERTLLGIDHIVISEEIYTEMKKVVTTKFSNFITDYQAFEIILRESTILVSLGSISITACRDTKDNLILETAVLGDCDYIITGDKDLTSLDCYKNILIVTPKEAINLGILC